MKQTLTGLLVLLLVVGMMPLALADTEYDDADRDIDDDSRSDRNRGLSRDRAKVDDVEVRVKMDKERRMKMDKEKVLIEVRHKREANEKRREDLRVRYEKKRSDVIELREKLRNCATDEGDACEEYRKQFRGHVKEQLLIFIERAQHKLELIAEKLGDERDVTAEVKASIATFDELKIALEAATTKDEILDVAKQVKKAWVEAMHLIRKQLSGIAHQEVTTAVDHMEHKLGGVLLCMAERTDNKKLHDAILENFIPTVKTLSEEIATLKSQLADAGSEDEYKAVKEKLQQALTRMKQLNTRAAQLVRIDPELARACAQHVRPDAPQDVDDTNDDHNSDTDDSSDNSDESSDDSDDTDVSTN